eukprot:gene12092-14290_t
MPSDRRGLVELIAQIPLRDRSFKRLHREGAVRAGGLSDDAHVNTDVCTAGYYYSLASRSCDACGEGHFSPAASATSCTRCPDFASHNSGHTGCECNAGYEQDNAFADSAGQAACEPCPARSVAVDGVTCRCLPGFDLLVDRFSATHSNFACGSCDLGKYLSYNTDGAYWECVPCEAGTYMNETTRIWHPDRCLECPSNAVSCAGNSLAGLACPEATAGLAGGSSCTCDVGYFSLGDLSDVGFTCLPCPPGTFQDSRMGAPECTPCPLGTFSSVMAAADESVCEPCSAGYVAGMGATSCTICPAGALQFGAACLCRAGYSQNETAAVNFNDAEIKLGLHLQCTECPSGRHSSSPGKPECELCPPGTFTSGGAAEVCEPCPASTVSVMYGATSCSSCPENAQHSTTNRLECICPAGYTRLPWEGMI